MSLPRPQVCDCFGGNCWRQFCPMSSKNRKRAREREEAKQGREDTEKAEES